jgi:hypothetical protein
MGHTRMARPRVNASELGRLFNEGKLGRTNNIEIVDGKNNTFVVDYGWAILGKRNKKTGEITYYSGWRGYSRTTSKHIGQMGLYSGKEVEGRPEITNLTEIDT